MADVMNTWKVWLSDGTTYCSHNNTWDNVPADDIQVVMVYFKDTYTTMIDGTPTTVPTREIIQGKDFYGKNQKGDLIASNKQSDIKSGLKNGKWMSDSGYDALVKTATGDYFC